ncbi:hypothetical protein C0J52_19324 [Blattella germanica]|nr:hypothetical protein C0J52_19324 [Blattella germanica]
MIQRCVKLQNMCSMSKEQLVELFHRVAVPLPQRKYKENRRGKLLTKMRRKQERSNRKEEPAQHKSNITYGFSEASTSHRLELHNNSHQSGDRLKPPPDAINFERKKIRLNSKSSSDSVDLEDVRTKRLKKFDNKDSNGDILDRIIIKDRRKEREKEEKKESNSTNEKSAAISSSTNRDEKSHDDSDKNESSSGSRKIKLKRTHSTVSTEGKSPTASSPTSTSEKKKHKTIKWP